MSWDVLTDRRLEFFYPNSQISDKYSKKKNFYILKLKFKWAIIWIPNYLIPVVFGLLIGFSPLAAVRLIIELFASGGGCGCISVRNCGYCSFCFGVFSVFPEPHWSISNSVVKRYKSTTILGGGPPGKIVQCQSF